MCIRDSLDAHAILRPAEQARDLGAHERWALRGGVDRDAVVAGVRNRDERFECQVKHLLGAECVLKHMRGGGKGLVDVAASQPKIERNIGALAALEMLEVGEGAGGL